MRHALDALTGDLPSLVEECLPEDSQWRLAVRGLRYLAKGTEN